MADTQTLSVSLLMGLPLEVRHNIFEHAAARDVKPKKLLRYWFEKKEVKELIAQIVDANPTGPAPRVVHSNEYEEDSDIPEPEEEGAEEQDNDDEDGEDGEDNEDNDHTEADQAQAQDGNAQGTEGETEDDMQDDQDSLLQGSVHPHTTIHDQALPTHTQIAAPAQPQPGTQQGPADEAVMETDEPAETADVVTDVSDTQSGQLATDHVHDEIDEDGDEAMVGQDGEGNHQGAQEDGHDREEEGEDGEDAVQDAQPPPPPAPVVRASRKWRYIPNFMRITHCPPPAELLLASKQLNNEAKNWFYDVAILRISATNSFAHTSFFEEALSQITEAAFSPMENIRKVEVMFVWDTTWLRADQAGIAEAIFPALLRQRADFVHKILSQAPDLREVTIDWHDSAHDDQSVSFMLDILAPFHELNATVKIEEHYIAADAKPHERSIAGRQRLQFQQIIDAGLDRLF